MSIWFNELFSYSLRNLRGEKWSKVRYTDIVILTQEKKFPTSFQREMLLNINGYPEFCQHDEWIRVKVGQIMIELCGVT